MGQKQIFRKKLCAAFCAAFFIVATQHNATAQDESEAERSIETVMADLASGGSVILMRHANSPSDQVGSVGLTDGCVLGEGRGLDAKGFFQARFIGEFLTSYDVPVTAAFSSDMCRTWDTARLVAAGTPVMASQALKTTDVTTIENFKQIIATTLAGAPRENVLLVTHSNIVPLYADWGGDGEIPSGVIVIVDPKDWTVTEKLNLDIDLSVD
ncbi:MAG: phosphoglycerate mutase family protein [Pseudomonadota bacterium]